MVVLYRYLTITGSPIRLRADLTNPSRPPSNTTSDHFQNTQITKVTLYNLDWESLMQRGGHFLHREYILNPISISPPRIISNEPGFQADVINRHVIPWVRRAIEATHPNMTVKCRNAWPGNIAGGKPDVSFVEYNPEAGFDEKMRFPLEIKLSVNWMSDWNTSSNNTKRTHYLQVLSQIHYYMDIFNTRFGGILTDRELVIVQRTKHFGELLVSTAVSYVDHGLFTTENGRPTVALALWCMATQPDWYLQGHVDRDSSEVTYGDGEDNRDRDYELSE